jgi:hypothetical protein
MRAQTALFLALALVTPAAAQGGGYSPQDVPEQVPQEEVAKRVAKILDASPEATVEIDGVAKLTYRQIPTDVHAVAVEFAKTLSSNQVPRGIDRDVYVRQYEPQIGRLLEERFVSVGTFEALAPLEIRRKDIPVGEYGLGLAFRKDRPVAFVLTGDDLPKGKPLALKLKLSRADEDTGALKLELLAPEEQEAGELEFQLQATLRGALARTKKSFEQVISE